EELDKIISSYISNHGTATGQNYVGGHLSSLGLRIQRRRIREINARVDPQNTALRSNSNNLAETVLDLFLDAVQRDGNLWLSRIRVEKGVENVPVCDAMVQATEVR
ncbi:unnamed protein product, partial [Porites lobata]